MENNNYEEQTNYTQSVDSNNAPDVQPQHGMAVASLVLGIIGIVCCTPLSILSLVFAIVAKKSGNTEGITTAGLVLGIIGICLIIISIIVYVVLGTSFGALSTMQSLNNL